MAAPEEVATGLGWLFFLVGNILRVNARGFDCVRELSVAWVLSLLRERGAETR